MKEIKLKIPVSHKDITLEQYLKYNELKKRTGISDRELNKRKIMIFTHISYKEAERIEIEDYVNVINWLDEAMTTDHKFEYEITLNGIEFGFIPNLDEIQAKEFFDLKMYKDEDENLHKIMAVLFRPIKHRDKLKNYTIEEYRGTEKYSELMKQMPMHLVFGAIFFFRNLRMELSTHILQSIEVEHQKAVGQKISSSVGGGIRRFMNWRRGKRGSLKKSKT